MNGNTRRVAIYVLLALGALILSSTESMAQKRPGSIREFLLQYKGKEIQILDKTGGVEQFASTESNKAYTLVLNDVLSDHIIVTRATESDKRTFLYPISVIRRIIFMYDDRPYQKILLEMY